MEVLSRLGRVLMAEAYGEGREEEEQVEAMEE